MDNIVNKKNIKDTSSLSVFYSKALHEPYIYTNESFNITTIVILKEILTDLFISENKNINKPEVLKRIKLLNRLTFEDRFSIDYDTITMRSTFGFLREAKVGRIYPTKISLSSLTRDLRFYLCEPTYSDYDLINSHPSILLDFVKAHTIISAPLLEELVLHRKQFQEKILKEYPFRDIKKAILIALNSEATFTSSSITLKNINKEIVLIRKLIYQYCKDAHLNYSGAKLISGIPNFKRIQSFYCMTQESVLLMKLKKHILEQLKSTYGGEVLIQEEDENLGLHFIPIFDGALIRHENHRFNYLIDLFVETFNAGELYTKFKKKKFELPEDSVISLDVYDKYMNIHTSLKEIQGHKQFGRLLDKLSILPFSIDEETFKEITSSLTAGRDNLELLYKELKKAKRKKGNSLVDELYEKIDKSKSAVYLNEQQMNLLRREASKFSSNVRAELLKRTNGEPLLLRDFLAEDLEKIKKENEQ